MEKESTDTEVINATPLEAIPLEAIPPNPDLDTEALWRSLKQVCQVIMDGDKEIISVTHRKFKMAVKKLLGADPVDSSNLPVLYGSIKDPKINALVCKLKAWHSTNQEIQDKIKEQYNIVIPTSTLQSLMRSPRTRALIERYQWGSVAPSVKIIRGAHPIERARRLDVLFDRITEIDGADINEAIRIKLLHDNIQLQTKVSEPLQKYIDQPEDEEQLPTYEKKIKIISFAIRLLDDPTLIGKTGSREFEDALLERAKIVNKRRQVERDRVLSVQKIAPTKPEPDPPNIGDIL